MPTESGTWPCATCGTLVYPYEVRGDGCVDCPRVAPTCGTCHGTGLDINDGELVPCGCGEVMSR